MQLTSGILIFTCLLLALCSAQEDFGLEAEVDAAVAELQEQLDDVRHRLMDMSGFGMGERYWEGIRKHKQMRYYKDWTCSANESINKKLFLLAYLPTPTTYFYGEIKSCCLARWGGIQSPEDYRQNVENFCQCIDQVNHPKIRQRTTEFLRILKECPAEYGARKSEDDALANEVRDALVAGRL